MEGKSYIYLGLLVELITKHTFLILPRSQRFAVNTTFTEQEKRLRGNKVYGTRKRLRSKKNVYVETQFTEQEKRLRSKKNVYGTRKAFSSVNNSIQGSQNEAYVGAMRVLNYLCYSLLLTLFLKTQH